MSNKKNSGLTRRPSGLMALEQRFMFDGAAVDTAVDALGHADAIAVDAHPLFKVEGSAATSQVNQTMAIVQAQVRNTALHWTDQQWIDVFGVKANDTSMLEQLHEVQHQILDGSYQINVLELEASQMGLSMAAFAANGPDGKPTIFLNKAWWTGAEQDPRLQQALLEEVGHSIDAALHPQQDSTGDEGQLFAARVLGQTLSNDELSAMQQESDAGLLSYNGVVYQVEHASFNFTTAYRLAPEASYYAEKEQESDRFLGEALGVAQINDNTALGNFSGNDVVIDLTVAGVTYHGWISRPIKDQGVVRGFYFWYDPSFTTFALASADGNQDGDSTASDNQGFILVVDQNWFNSVTAGTPIHNNGTVATNVYEVGSSSDRVDSALNALVTSNAAPVANSDTTTGTPDASVAGRPALEQGYNTNTSNVITATVNATGNVLTNDTDSNGDSLVVSSLTSKATGNSVSPNGTGSFTVTGKYGTLTIYANGNYSYAVNNSNSTVDALLAGNVSEQFSYTASDSKGGTASATLTIQINGSNDAPVAVNDYNVAKEHTSTNDTGYNATGNVLPNDGDVDTGDTKTVTGSSVGGSATANVAVTAGSYDLTFSGSSGFSSVNTGWSVFVSLSGATTNGTVYTGLYTYDSANNKYNLVTVTKLSNGVTLNQTPTYYWDNTNNTFVQISNVKSFFSSYTKVLMDNYGTDSTPLAGETVTQTSSSKTAAVGTIAGTGYTTLSGLSAQSGTIAVGMSVTGTGIPSGTTVTDVTTTNGVITSVKLSSDQITSSNGTTFTFAGSSGVATTLTGTHGTLLLNADGSYTYTPFTDNLKLNAGDVATDVFDYTMRDTAGQTSAAKLYITVTGSGTNDPVLTADTATAYEAGVGRDGTNAVIGGSTAYSGTTASANVLANDKETYSAASNQIGTGYVAQVGRAGAGSYTTIDTASDGRTTLNSATVAGLYGSLLINDQGAYTYTVADSNSTVNALQVGQTLTDTFSYQVKNSLSPTGYSWSTLTITVQGTNDAPAAVADTGATLTEDVSTSTSGNVVTNDTDVDSGDTKTITKAGTSSANATVSSGTTSADGLVVDGTYGRLVLGADGTYTYTLGVTSAQNTAVQLLNTASTPATETFNYELTDGRNATSTTTLSFTINGTNEPPVNQINGSSFSNTSTTSYSTDINTALVFIGTRQLSVADQDNDLSSVTLTVENGTLSFTSSTLAATVSATTGVTITITGTQADINSTLALLQYTPSNNYTGSDYLTIASKDATDSWDTDGIAINIPTVFTGPTVVESNLASGSNASGTGEEADTTLTAPAGQTFGPSTQSGTDAYGTWTLTAGGLFTYTLTSAPAESGASSTRDIDVLTYDAYGNSITNTVRVTITDDAPTANSNTKSVNEGSTAAGNVLTDGSPDTFGADGPKTTTPAGGVVGVRAANSDNTTAVTTGVASSINGDFGTLTLNADGSYSYAANANSVSVAQQDVFVYTIEDADGDRSTTTLTITVNDISTPSLAVTGYGPINEASTYALFTVQPTSSNSSALINLSVSNGTATLVTPLIEYSTDGSTWLTYSSSSKPNGGGLFYVRVTIDSEHDSTYEESESFSLVAAYTANTSITDSASTTIIDDGTGTKYGPDFDPTNGPDTDTSSLDDDRAISVSGLDDVSEGSNSVFTVTLPDGNTRDTEISLTLSDGTAGSSDYSGSFTAYYYNGSTQVSLTITNGKITLPSGVTTFYVSVPTTQDTTLEGSENFTLTAAITAGKSASDTSSIVDDGTGQIYDAKGLNPTGPGNDDRAISVSGLDDVSEGSNSVFTVTLPDGNTRDTEISLTLSDGTAGSSDYSGSFTAYYYNGSTQVSLTITNGKITLPSGVTTFYVSVPTTQDTTLEGSENFTLTAAITAGKSASDTSSIVDDGTGQIYDAKGLNPTGPGNDDRAISVSGLDDVSEGSNSVFTVTLPDGNTRDTEISLTLSDGTAGSSDYSGSFTAYYYNGSTQVSLTITNGKITLPSGVTTFYVSVPTTQDTTLEGSENFTLTAAITAGKSASDTSSIVDDGTGQIYDAKGLNPTGPGNDDRAISVSGLDDVSEGSNSVFTVTLPDGNTRDTEISLTLSDGTAGSSDYSGSFTAYYYNGSTQVSLTITNGKITLPSGVTTFYVSVPTTQDTTLEGSENFTLTAAITAGKSASDTSSIVDDGTGQIYDAKGLNPTGPGNDDRAISVSGLDDVSEGSNSVFTVTLPDGNTRDTEISLTLSDGTAGSSDYSGSFTAYYYNGSTQVSLTITNGKITLPSGVTTFYVSVPTTQDTTLEGSENFTLTAAITAGKSASDTSSIVDDGTGQIYDAKGLNPTGPGNDDRAISVSGLDDVSEGSNSVFTVTLPDGNTRDTEISLTLSDGTAGSSDYSGSFTAYYYNGSTQVSLTITNGKITLPSGVTTFYVSVPTTQDTTLEGSENFTLTAAITAGKSASDTSSIVDDGTGQIYDAKGLNPTGPGNDDRAISVSGLDDVSEGSNSVFTVTLPDGNTRDTEISLTLSDGTAGSSDYSGSFTAYYYNGSTQVSLTITNGKITLPSGVTTFYVSVPTTQDTTLEGSENFTLTAAITAGKSASDTSSIVDDGTGQIYDAKGLNPTGPGNDDRAISVSGLDDVSEGSNSVFTVTLPDGNTRDTEISLTLSDGTAGSSDYSGSFTAYYYNGSTQVSLTITNGKITLPSGVTTFYVSVPTTQDTTLEGSENFTLTAAITAGKSASDTSSIVDDGTGQIYDAKGLNPTGPGNDDRAISVSGLDDVSEGSNSVFTVTLPDGNTRDTEISLTLSDGTAGSSDYSGSFTAYYYNGSTQVSLTITNGKITLPSGVTTFYVSVPTTQDTTLEGSENFTLTAAITAGKSASDTSSIVDDGTGQIYDAKGLNPTGPGDNDRAPTPAPPPPAPRPALPPLVPAEPPQPSPAPVPTQALPTVHAEVPLALNATLTSASGHQIIVSETARPGLSLYQGVTDQFVQSTSVATKISMPFDAFVHTNKDAVIKLNAKQADDSPLPKWVQFDPTSGTFEVTPPKGFKGKLDLKVIARDDDGREAVALFQMFIGEQQTPGRPQSRESFSEKLRLAGQRSITLERVAEIRPHKVAANEAKAIRVRGG